MSFPSLRQLHLKYRRFRRQKQGVALIEFTILMPFVFGLVFGIIEFGRYFQQKQVAEKGMKAAARYLSRVVDTTGCPPSGAAFANAQSMAQVLAIYGEFDSSATPSLSNWSDPADVVIAVGCVDNSPDANGVRPWRTQRNSLPIVTVSTEFAFNDLGLLSALGLDDLKVSAQHQELFVGG